MKPTIIFFVLLFIAPFVKAQEITTTEDFLTDYEVAWEIQKEPGKMFFHFSENYFGFIPEDGGVYKHFNKSGSLVWSTESLDYNPKYISLSREGDRILAMHFTKTPEGYWQTDIDVFNISGEYLFTYHSWAESGFSLKSSPNGKFYFGSPGIVGYDDFVVFDGNGKIIMGRDGSYWEAEALDDSLVVIIDGKNIQVIDVMKDEVIREKPFELISGGSSSRYFLTCSRDGKKMALWNDNMTANDVSIMDKDLNMLGHVAEETRILALAFSDDSNALSLIVSNCTVSQCNLALYVYGLDGNKIGQLLTTLPAKEALGGGLKEISFCKDFLVLRLRTFSKIEKRSYNRSLLIRIKPITKEIISNAFLASEIYTFGNSCDFVEINGDNIKGWCKKERNNKKD